jgi:hypothetical protein
MACVEKEDKCFLNNFFCCTPHIYLINIICNLIWGVNHFVLYILCNFLVKYFIIDSDIIHKHKLTFLDVSILLFTDVSSSLSIKK